MNSESDVELIENQGLQESQDKKTNDMFGDQIHAILRLLVFEPLMPVAHRGVSS